MEISKKYELFVRLLEEEKIYMNPELKFMTVCGWLDIAPEMLEKHIFAETGMTGEEVLEMYRSQASERIRQKYGIVI